MGSSNCRCLKLPFCCCSLCDQQHLFYIEKFLCLYKNFFYCVFPSAVFLVFFLRIHGGDELIAVLHLENALHYNLGLISHTSHSAQNL